ncbi:MAG: MFS transporter [Chloroflexi bacterium]|nr:MFS transporter [Chloroflexota bacterium]
MARSAPEVPISREAQVAWASRAVILAAFVSNLGFNFVFPLLPLYVRELSGPGPATAIWSGVILAASPMAGAIASPFWGRLTDRLSYRTMLLWALVSTSVFIGLMTLPNAPWQLLILRILAGAFGSIQAVAMAALAAWTRPEDLSKVISRLQMSQVFGVIVGPMAGGLVAAFFDVRFAPLAGACSLAVGTLLVARWLHEPAGRRARIKGPVPKLKPSYLWLPIVTLLAVQFTDSSFNPILPLLLAQGAGATGTVAGLTGAAASMSATAAAIGAGLSGQLIKRGVRKRMIVPALSILALFTVAATMAPLPGGSGFISRSCGGMVAGITVAAYSAGGLSVEPSQRGAAYGWLASSGMTGNATSPIFAGLLATIDLRAVLVLDTALCVLSAVGWGFSRRPASAAPPVPTKEELSTG